MTLYQYFLFWYLIPLTINVIFFFLFMGTIERMVSDYILYYLKMTFFIPVVNILQSISFTVCLLIIIKSEIIYYYLKMKSYYIMRKKRRTEEKELKKLAGLLIKAMTEQAKKDEQD